MFFLGRLPFLLYINDIPQALDSEELLLHANDSCLVFQRKDVKAIEKQLNRDFSTLIDLIVDNKLSVLFDEDKLNQFSFLQNIV